MTEEENNESTIENVQKINPKGKYFFQFPEGMSDEEKASFDTMIETAKKEGRNVYIEPTIKVVGIDEVTKAPEPKPAPVPEPVKEEVKQEVPVQQPQPQPQPVQQQQQYPYMVPQEQAFVYQHPQGGYHTQQYQPVNPGMRTQGYVNQPTQNTYYPGMLPPGYMPQQPQQQPLPQPVPNPNYNAYNPQQVVPIGQHGPTQALPQGQGGGQAGVRHNPQLYYPPNQPEEQQ